MNRTNRRLYLAVFGLCLAFLLRLLWLGQRSYWYDEAYTVWLSQQSVSTIIRYVAVWDTNTPLHYLLVKLWRVGSGETEFALRFLSVCFSTLTLALVVRYCRKAHTPIFIALLAGLACSGVEISLAQEMRMYAPLAFFCVLSTYALDRLSKARTSQSASWLAVVWSVSLLLAVATHTLGCFVFAAHMVLVLLRLRHFPGLISWVGLATCLVGAGLVGSVLFVGKGYSAFDTPLALPKLTSWALGALYLPRGIPEEWIWLASVAAALTLVWAYFSSTSHRMVWWTLVLSVCGIAALGMATGKFQARYTAFLLPLLFMSLCASSNQTNQINRRWTIPVLFGVALLHLCSGLAWHTKPEYTNDNWRAALGFVAKHIQPQEPILLVSGHAFPAYQYYAEQHGLPAAVRIPNDPVLNLQHTLDYDSLVPTINKTLSGKKRAWLLLWQDHVIDPSHLTEVLLKRQAHRLQADLEQHFEGNVRVLRFSFDQPYQPLSAQLPSVQSHIDTTYGKPVGLASLGCHQFRLPQQGSTLMEVACFWQLKPFILLPFDTKLSLRLYDTQGQLLAQEDQNLIQPYGVPHFPFEKPMTTFYFMTLPKALKKGKYRLVALPYLPSGEIAPLVKTDIVVQ